MGQIAVVVFALISFALAYLMPDIVTAIVFAYTMYTAGLLIPMYVGFYGKALLLRRVCILSLEAAELPLFGIY